VAPQRCERHGAVQPRSSHLHGHPGRLRRSRRQGGAGPHGAVIELSAAADQLSLTTPVTVADLLTFPAKIREVGQRRAGTWTNPEEQQP
jgi:hypothetical protein